MPGLETGVEALEQAGAKRRLDSADRDIVRVRPDAAPPSSSAHRFLLIFAAVAMTVLMAAAVRWSLDHPYGVHWDEAEYFNDVQIDVHRLQSGMLLHLAGRWLLKSWGRPPAFRILADPILAVLGFRTFTARLISLAWFLLSSGFVYRAVSRVASRSAATLAALVFVFSPEVVSASLFFGTDTSLYLATSAMLYYLFAIWGDKSQQSQNWIGLGAAIGLGFLAKTSFLVIALPVLAFWFVAAQWGKWDIPRPLTQWKAGVLALLIAGPWWLLNLKAALAYGHYARTFVRNSLGPPSLATGIRWLYSVVQCLLGHGIGTLIALVLIAYLARMIARKPANFSSLQKAALVACACAAFPIICAQLSGTNHLLRHISPAMIPLAIAVGILVDRARWERSPSMIAVSCALLCVQLGMLVAPVVSPNTHPVDLGFINGAPAWRTMARFDQWNWKPVLDLSDSCGVKSPKISYLGNGRAFNKPQIEYPFVARGTSIRGTIMEIPDATWLWRYENGPIDWQKMMDAANQSDVVLTAPHYSGEARYKEDQDNEYNAEFAGRLSQSGNFRPAILLQMGRFEPVEVFVYLNKNLVCQPGEAVPTAQ